MPMIYIEKAHTIMILSILQEQRIQHTPIQVQHPELYISIRYTELQRIRMRGVHGQMSSSQLRR